MSTAPIRTFGGAPARVVIVGGGVAGLEAVLALRALAQERVAIDLVAPNREFIYRPLSVLVPFDGGETPRFDLGEMAADQGVRHYVEEIAAVDTERRRVRTGSGRELRYDALIVATGTELQEGLPGALTFAGPANAGIFSVLLDEIREGIATRIVFAMPPGLVWTLPLYELALNTAAFMRKHYVTFAEVTLITEEEEPLALFGQRASETVGRLLQDAGIRVLTATYPMAVTDGKITVVPHGELECDRVITLPRLKGVPIAGIPHDDGGFIRTDLHGLVEGLSDVYAAGDVTSLPVKQGGVAAQQADAVAESIAARAGAPITPRPFRPVLRGMLLTGGNPRYLSADVTRYSTIEPEAESEPLWWPPSKIFGHYLAPYLGRHGAHFRSNFADDENSEQIPFEVELETVER